MLVSIKVSLVTLIKNVSNNIIDDKNNNVITATIALIIGNASS